METAKKLLELQAEYADVRESDDWGIDGVQPRSLEDISEEYNQALREFIGGLTGDASVKEGH